MSSEIMEYERCLAFGERPEQTHLPSGYLDGSLPVDKWAKIDLQLCLDIDYRHLFVLESLMSGNSKSVIFLAKFLGMTKHLENNIVHPFKKDGCKFIVKFERRFSKDREYYRLLKERFHREKR
eukprot:157620_1